MEDNFDPNIFTYFQHGHFPNLDILSNVLQYTDTFPVEDGILTLKKSINSFYGVIISAEITFLIFGNR